MPHMLLSDNKTYLREARSDPRDRIRVEIGDSKQPRFHPQVKIMRWDNEVNFSARLIDDEVDLEPTVNTDADIVNWEKNRKDIKFYEIPASEQHPEGAYEFEITLNEKPDTNKVQFTIRAKGLEFYYQHELTAEQIARGMSRPDNVVGSYAVYYKDCPLNIEGGKLYRTGKAFHIYRPRIEDSAGNWTWGTLHVDTEDEILTVTIPQEFLDCATYPVHHAAGLTLGYTSIGATLYPVFLSYLLSCGCYYMGQSGTGQSMSAYAVGSIVNNLKLGLYIRTGVLTGTKVAETGEISVSTTPGWRTGNFLSVPTLNAVNYRFAQIGSYDAPEYLVIYIDEVVGDDDGFITVTNRTFPGDFVLSGSGGSSTRGSIYVTYTASGGGGEVKQGGSQTSIAVSAQGAGRRISSGGSSATATATSAQGAGTRISYGGSSATAIAVSAQGAGGKIASGSANAAITIAVQAQGVVVQLSREGASQVQITITPEGGWNKLARASPSDTSISTASEGAGLAARQGGSEASGIIISVQSQGRKTATGSASASAGTIAEGVGTKINSGSGEIGTTTSVEAHGSKFALGSSDASIAVNTQGVGSSVATIIGGTDSSIETTSEGAGIAIRLGASSTVIDIVVASEGVAIHLGASGAVINIGEESTGIKVSGGAREISIEISTQAMGIKAGAGSAEIGVAIFIQGQGVLWVVRLIDGIVVTAGVIGNRSISGIIAHGTISDIIGDRSVCGDHNI